MLTYIVKDTTIIHARDKEPAKTYNPGDEIELTKDEAIGLSVELKKGKKDVDNADGLPMSKKEIIEALKELGVEIPKNANKDTLIALLESSRDNPAE